MNTFYGYYTRNGTRTIILYLVQESYVPVLPNYNIPIKSFSLFKIEKYFFNELSNKYKCFFCLLNMLYFINVFVLCITWYGFVFICVRASLYVLVVVSLASICKYPRVGHTLTGGWADRQTDVACSTPRHVVEWLHSLVSTFYVNKLSLCLIMHAQ